MNKAVTYCPLCEKNGLKRIVKQFHVNLEESVSICVEKECLYPLVDIQTPKFSLEKKSSALINSASSNENNKNAKLEEESLLPELDNKRHSIHSNDDISISDMLDGFLLDCQTEDYLESIGKSEALLEIEQMLLKNLDLECSDSRSPEDKQKSIQEDPLTPGLNISPIGDIPCEKNEILIISKFEVENTALQQNINNGLDNQLESSSGCQNLRNASTTCSSMKNAEENKAATTFSSILKSNNFETDTKEEKGEISVSENVEATGKIPIKALTSVQLNYPHLRNVDSLCWLDVSLMILIHNVNLRKLLWQGSQGKLLKLLKVYLQQLALLNKSALGNDNELSWKEKTLLEYPSDKEENSLVTLEDEREHFVAVLEPKLKFKRGQEESPIFALPHLLEEESEIVELFQTRHVLKFRCGNCRLEEERSSESVILTVPKIPEKFSVLDISFKVLCLHCKDASQVRSIHFERLPVNLMIHFVEGISCKNLWSYNFEHMGFQYIISGIIQYKTNPNHYVTWIYNKEEKFWLEFDDLKSTPKIHYVDYPVFPLQQYHILVWEKILDNRDTVSWPSLLKLYNRKDLIFKTNKADAIEKITIKEDQLASQMLSSSSSDILESFSVEEQCKIDTDSIGMSSKECRKPTENMPVSSYDSLSEKGQLPSANSDSKEKIEIHDNATITNTCMLPTESSVEEVVKPKLCPEKGVGRQINTENDIELKEESVGLNEKLLDKGLSETSTVAMERDIPFLGQQHIIKMECSDMKSLGTVLSGINKDCGKTSQRTFKVSSVETLHETPWLLSPPASETISDTDSLEIHELAQLNQLQENSNMSDNKAQLQTKLSSDLMKSSLQQCQAKNIADIQKCCPLLLLPQPELTNNGQQKISVLKLSADSVSQLLNILNVDVTTIIVPQQQDSSVNVTVLDNVIDIVKSCIGGSQDVEGKNRKCDPKTEASIAMEKCGNWINQSAAQFGKQASQNVETVSLIDQEVSNDSSGSAFSYRSSSHFSDKTVTQSLPSCAGYSSCTKKKTAAQNIKSNFFGYETVQNASPSNCSSTSSQSRAQKNTTKKQCAAKKTTMKLKGVDKSLLFHAKNKHFINSLTSNLDFSEAIAKSAGKLHTTKRKSNSSDCSIECKRPRSVSMGSMISNSCSTTNVGQVKTVSPSNREATKSNLRLSRSVSAFEGYKSQLSEAQSSEKNSVFHSLSTYRLHQNSLHR